jgi:hypothetical protein
MIKRVVLCVATCIGLLAACGDDEVLPDGGGPTPDAAAPGDPDAEIPTSIVYALGTDFTTAGVLTKVEVPTLNATQNAIAGVASTDPVARRFGDKLYIVNRFGFDNVTIIDLTNDQLIDQISTGAGTNPQDVAVKGDKIYVAALASGDIIVLDAANPTATPTTIDISSYDTGDDVPDANTLHLAGDTLLVAVGALDGSFTSTAGKVILIDTTNDTVTGDFDLAYNNPIGYFQPHGAGEVLIATTVDFADGDGCLERIDITGTPASAGCLVENSVLGGYPTVYRSDGTTVLAAISISFTEGKLVSIDSTGTPSASITPAGQTPTDVEVCPTGHIVVNDGAGGGLRVYTATGNELTENVIDIGQPPAFTNGLICP